MSPDMNNPFEGLTPDEIDRLTRNTEQKARPYPPWVLDDTPEKAAEKAAEKALKRLVDNLNAKVQESDPTTKSEPISSPLVLRDPSRPCEHPSEDIANGYAHSGAWFDDNNKYWECDNEECPGGKKIVIDSDMIARMAQAYAEAEGFISPLDDAHVAMRIALGVMVGVSDE